MKSKTTGLWPNQKPFRPVDEWKSALMTLPENSFFELLRSVLGNIKTPFSKQRLSDDLFNLLSRDEIRKTIAAYINEQDHKVIAAVALLNEPAPGGLEKFFAGEFSPAELHTLIINLEERLILYRFRDEEGLRLALNPVLEQVLAPLAADASPLFTSYKDETNAQVKEAGTPAEVSKNLASRIHGSPPEAFMPDCRIMAALFAFIQNEEELFRTEGGIRKKVLDAGKKIFPGLDLAIRVFLRLGFFRSEGRSLVSCNERVTDYCALSAVERQEYWTAAVYLCLSESDSGANKDGSLEESQGSWFSWIRLRGIASFIHRFRSFLDPERKYPEVTLKRLGELLEREGTGNIWDSSMFGSKAKFPFEGILAAMEKTGLLAKRDSCWKTGGAIATPGGEDDGEDAPEKPVIAMDAAFSFILYPEISFADAMELGMFCSVKEKEKTTVRFELTRQSVVRGFDRGMGADAMITLLDRLSHNRIDANLGWTLKEWESRHAGVSLHQGIVLSLAEEHRYLAEAGSVARLIRKTLAPGVYLLSSEERPEAARILRKAGVDIVAQPPSGAGISRSGFSRNTFTRLGSSSAEYHSLFSPPSWEKNEPSGEADTGGEPRIVDAMPCRAPAEGSADSIKQKFRQALEKMRLTKPERDELLARIERRLVLSEAQLDGTSLRYEKLEARGLDYAGKSAIAKQAIEAGSLLEVSWPGPGGGLNRTVGIPQALEKKEGDSVLVLRSGGNSGIADSGNTPRVFRIPLGKISLLRRIKQSIFGE